MKITPSPTSRFIGTLCIGTAVSSSAIADFLSDSHATLGLRNYYINSDFRDGSAAPSKSEEWAQGFMLKFESGYTSGPVGFGVDALGLAAVKLDGGKGHHPGGSMIPDASDGSGVDEWSRLGVTGKARFSKTELRYGTLMPKLPILVSSDARLLPQTFEGLLVTSKEIDDLTLTGGWIDKATGRASTNRTGLAVLGPATGNQESDGLFLAGADYKITKQLTGQYYYSNLKDYYTQNFLGLVHLFPIGENQSLKTDLRYFRTRSDGANSSASGRADGYRVGGYTKDGTGEIDNDTWSAYMTYSHGSHTFTAGYQRVSDDSNFVQPNQNGLGEGAVGAAIYLYTDRLVGQFNRAGENTKYGAYGYDFTALGVPGLTTSISYYGGEGIRTASGRDAEEWERDLFVDYVIQSGPLKGVGLGWRNIMYRGDIQRDQDENRLIISYAFSLL